MKTIEEKAKAYDEAIKVAKNNYETIVQMDNDCTFAKEGIINTFHHMFPELKENEDEMIRKALIYHYQGDGCLCTNEYRIDYKEIRAWLEKQEELTKELQAAYEEIGRLVKEIFLLKEQKPKFKVGDNVVYTDPQGCKEYGIIQKNDSSVDTFKDKVVILVGGCIRTYHDEEELELVEQNPVGWNIQDAKKGDILSNGTIVLIFDSVGKFEGRDIINSRYYADPEKFYGKGTSECDQWETEGFRPASEAEKNYLFKMMNKEGYMWDSAKNQLLDIEKPVEWSEEDESMLNNVIDTLVPLSQTTHSGYAIGSMINWLNSLKDRVQPQSKQEWSKEDENNILFLTSIIEECFKDKEKITLYGDTVCASFTKENVIDRLKSLRPQKHWKPSEEQMKAINHAIQVFAQSPYMNENDYLFNMFKGLKKDLEQLKAL